MTDTNRTGAEDTAGLIAEARNEAADANWTVRDSRPELLNHLASALEHSAAREKALRDALTNIMTLGGPDANVGPLRLSAAGQLDCRMIARGALAGEK